MLRLTAHVVTRGATKQSCQHGRSLFGFGSQKSTVKEAINEVAISPIDISEEHRESYIPLTRRSLFRYISQEKKLLQPHEREPFEDLSIALDSIITRRYQEKLHELKNLFDPINPDKDTHETRSWNRRQRLDSEFWLLERLSDLIDEANFRELSRKEVEQAMKDYTSRHGVMVSFDIAQYDVLKLWVLSREESTQHVSLLRRLMNALSWKRRPPGETGEDHIGMYKRVLLAVRMKRNDKLALKLFKDIPEDALGQLMPEGRLSITNFDKIVIQSGIGLGVAGFGVLAGLWWFNLLQPSFLLVYLSITGIAGGAALRSWSIVEQRRKNYLSRLNNLLYWHNVANNRGLLTLITDRAQEEAFKEALLVFSFLNAARDEGGLMQEVLDTRIEGWLEQRCQLPGLKFGSKQAIELLHSLGVVVIRETDEGHKVGIQAPSIIDVTARLPVEPKGMLLLRPSPTEDEAFDGPSGLDISRQTNRGWA